MEKKIKFKIKISIENNYLSLTDLQDIVPYNKKTLIVSMDGCLVITILDLDAYYLETTINDIENKLDSYQYSISILYEMEDQIENKN